MVNKVKRLGKETLIYGTSTILARMLNFFLVPFYTYYLITSDYGVIATVFAFMALFNIIYQYGMDQAYLRFAEDNKTNDTFSTPFLAVCGTSVLLSVLIYFLSPVLAGFLGIGANNAYLIKYCVFILAFDALNIVPFAKLRFEHRAWHFVLVRSASIIVNVGGNICALAFFNWGVSGVFAAGILASLTSLILLIPVVKESFVFKFDKNLFKQMFNFSWPFIPAGLASILVNVIDKPLLSHLTTLGDVGVYQANFKIGIFMMLIVSMFDQAWRPFFIQEAKEPNAKQTFAEIFTWAFALLGWVFLGLALLMPLIIQTNIFGLNLINRAYWGGIKIIPLVVGGYFFYGCYINFMVAPVLTKKTTVLMKITLVGAAVSILVNILLVPHLGIIGAGWAIFTSYFVMALCLFAFGQKNYKIDYEYKKIFLMALLIIALFFVGNHFGCLPTYKSYVSKIILLCLYPLIVFLILQGRRPKLPFKFFRKNLKK